MSGLPESVLREHLELTSYEDGQFVSSQEVMRLQDIYFAPLRALPRFTLLPAPGQNRFCAASIPQPK